jgi:hypothetical protein
VILIIGLAVAVGVTVARGGRLSRLAAVRFRWWGLVIAALALQVLVISVIPGQLPSSVAQGLHIGTYVLAGVFLLRNLAVPGLWLLGIGGASNMLAIAANNGIMPAWGAAMRLAGRVTPPGRFANSRVLSHPHLLPLGDVLAVPGWMPLANVFSFGDVVLVLGGALLIDRACRTHGPDPLRVAGTPEAREPGLVTTVEPPGSGAE